MFNDGMQVVPIYFEKSRLSLEEWGGEADGAVCPHHRASRERCSYKQTLLKCLVRN